MSALEQKGFQVMLKMTVELMHWRRFRECVPDGGSGSRKGSAAESGESDRCTDYRWRL